MYSYRIEDSTVLRSVLIVGFFLLDAFLLVAFLALGMMLPTALVGNPITAGSSILSLDELRRAVGAALVFMMLSGYTVSVAILTAIFRNQLLSRARTIWLVLLFVLHAAVFLFYLNGPAVIELSALLIAVGVICVIAVTAVEYVLWRRWLLAPKISATAPHRD